MGACHFTSSCKRVPVFPSGYFFWQIAAQRQDGNEIGEFIQLGKPALFLSQFNWLVDDAGLFFSAIDLMGKYNLLPNDALILGNCISHQIKAIASYDPDFVIPCKTEGITLINNIHQLGGKEPPSWDSLVNEP